MLRVVCWVGDMCDSVDMWFWADVAGGAVVHPCMWWLCGVVRLLWFDFLTRCAPCYCFFCLEVAVPQVALCWAGHACVIWLCLLPAPSWCVCAALAVGL